MVAIGISGLLGGRLFEGFADNISIFLNPVLTLAVFALGVVFAFGVAVAFFATGFFAVAFGFAFAFAIVFLRSAFLPLSFSLLLFLPLFALLYYLLTVTLPCNRH